MAKPTHHDSFCEDVMLHFLSLCCLIHHIHTHTWIDRFFLPGSALLPHSPNFVSPFIFNPSNIVGPAYIMIHVLTSTRAGSTHQGLYP